MEADQTKLVLLFSRISPTTSQCSLVSHLSRFSSALRLRDLLYGVLLSWNRKKLHKTLKLLYALNDDTWRFVFHFASHLILIPFVTCI